MTEASLNLEMGGEILTILTLGPNHLQKVVLLLVSLYLQVHPSSHGYGRYLGISADMIPEL